MSLKLSLINNDDILDNATTSCLLLLMVARRVILTNKREKIRLTVLKMFSQTRYGGGF